MKGRARLAPLVVALCAATAPRAATETPEAPLQEVKPVVAAAACASQAYQLDERPTYQPLNLNYPSSERYQLGEGWVRYSITLSPEGAVKDVLLTDAVGSERYAREATQALRETSYSRPILRGKPTEAAVEFEISFRMEGENRGGVHYEFNAYYDRARNHRNKGDYAQALMTLRDGMKRPLNLYEIATMSYATAVTYMGLNDWRRALIHSRHAVIRGGEYADRGVRQAAFAMTIELLARDHDYRRALCSYAQFKKAHPDAQISPSLQQAVVDARSATAGVEPIRTEVEIVESGRDDIPPFWAHVLLRPSFSLERLEGGVKTTRLACTDRVVTEAVVPGRSVQVPAGMNCDLHVFGDPGAKFVLDER